MCFTVVGESILIDVELCDFVDCGGADVNPDVFVSEKNNFCDAVKYILANINLGNDLFQHGDYKTAAHR